MTTVIAESGYNTPATYNAHTVTLMQGITIAYLNGNYALVAHLIQNAASRRATYLATEKGVAVYDRLTTVWINFYYGWALAALGHPQEAHARLKDATIGARKLRHRLLYTMAAAQDAVIIDHLRRTDPEHYAELFPDITDAPDRIMARIDTFIGRCGNPTELRNIYEQTRACLERR